MWYIIWILGSSPTDFHSEKIGLIRVTYDPPVSIRVNEYLKSLSHTFFLLSFFFLSLSLSLSLSKRINAVARPRCYMILMFKTIQTELLFLYLHIIIMCVLRSLQRKWNWWWCCQRRISFRRTGKSKREFWPKIFSFSYDSHLTKWRDLKLYTLELLYVW